MLLLLIRKKSLSLVAREKWVLLFADSEKNGGPCISNTEFCDNLGRINKRVRLFDLRK